MSTKHGHIEDLSQEQMTNLLESEQVAHLGCHNKDEVYVVPITYAIDDGYIYMHSKNGKKIDIMRKNPSICIQVDNIKDYCHWKSIIAHGRFEELSDLEAARAMHILIRKTLRKQNHKVSSLEFDYEALLEKSIIFRMRIEKLTGRFEQTDR